MDQDEEILYEEEALHEEEIDPSVGGMDDSEDFYVDESTAGKEVYADSDIEGEMGQGGGAMIDEDIQDDATGVFGDHSDSVYCIATSSDTNSVITGGGDDKAFIWNWRDGSKKAELTGFKESVNSVGFSFDGKYAAAADLAGEVRLWEAATGKEYTLEGPGETIEWLTWHSKGSILMAGSADGCTYMWAAATQALMGIFAGHSGSVTCGMFTPDGKKVVTGAEDGSARIWNPKDQQCVATFSGHLWHSLPLTCLEVKSDSQLFITGSEDSYACVGNIATNKPVAKLTGHAASVECVGFSINQNNFVYSGSMDGTLKVWDLNTSQCRATCVHDEATEDHGVTRLVALANQVVTSSTDGVVRLWDERTGLVVKKFTGHRDVILDMVTTQDKSAIITTSDDNTSRVFIL